MLLQCLNLLKENTLFDLDLRVQVIRNVAQYPLHHVIYAPAKFEVATSNSFRGDALTRKHYLTFDLDLGVKVIQNVTQYPLHHVTYVLQSLMWLPLTT